MPLFRAHFDTRHFEFEGYGRTADEAIEVCYAGWIEHAKSYNPSDNVDPNYVTRDDIAVYPIEVGKAYRDREAI